MTDKYFENKMMVILSGRHTILIDNDIDNNIISEIE